MSENECFRYFPLPMESHHLLQEYCEQLKSLQEAKQTLIKDAETKMRKTSIEHNKKLEILWKRMALICGLDPHKTWGDITYGIEARYIDEGFGALTLTPVEIGPLSHIFGESQRENMENIRVSDKSNLN